MIRWRATPWIFSTLFTVFNYQLEALEKEENTKMLNEYLMPRKHCLFLSYELSSDWIISSTALVCWIKISQPTNNKNDDYLAQKSFSSTFQRIFTCFLSTVGLIQDLFSVKDWLGNPLDFQYSLINELNPHVVTANSLPIKQKTNFKMEFRWDFYFTEHTWATNRILFSCNFAFLWH